MDFEVGTGVLATASVWVAIALVVLAVASVLVARRAVRLAHVLAVFVCFAAPFYTGLVLANAFVSLADSYRVAGGFLVTGGGAGILGLTLGGLSFTFGPWIIDELRAGTLFSPRRARHQA